MDLFLKRVQENTSLVSGRLSGASNGFSAARGGLKVLTSRANSLAHGEEQQTTLTKAIPLGAQPPGGIPTTANAYRPYSFSQ